MRLERFKNVVIPVDGVIYAEYVGDDRKKASSKFVEPNTTCIYFFSPNAPEIFRSVTFEGDCLDEFNEWFSKFNVASKTIRPATYLPASTFEPVLKFSPDIQIGYSGDINGPAHTLTVAHTDGTQETTVLYNKTDETSDTK